MENKLILYRTMEEFLNEIRSRGRHSFGLMEVKNALELSDKALNQVLFRYKAKKRIAQIRKGFYAILSPEYAKQGMVPVTMFIDDLMKLLNKRYYIGLISAAALHGAAHQQPMEFFVITQKPALRGIKNKKLKINFYVKKDWSDEDIMQKKTDAGYINVSSPELTALDLLYYMDTVTINQTVTILKELMTEMQVSALFKTASKYPQVAAIQRLGYLLDNELQNEKLADALAKTLKDKKLFPVNLSNSKSKDGTLNDNWKVIKNTNIESDI